MTQFAVLDPNQAINKNALLEASAGTGKTFTIEHLCVRLLLEGDRPLRIQEILIVTFTRAATQELRSRVRESIQRALRQLQGWTEGHQWEEGTPAYLLCWQERSREEILAARHRLEAALVDFGSCQIFTIHGFCHRMLLEQCTDVTDDEGIAPLRTSRLRQVIRDFFRTELNDTLVSPGQLRLAGTASSLEGRLSKLLTQPLTVRAAFDLASLDEAVNRVLREAPETLPDDLSKAALQYTGLCDRQGKLKDLWCKAIERLRELTGRGGSVDDLFPDLGPFVQQLRPENLQKRVKDPLALHSSVQELSQLAELAGDKTRIEATLASSCQQLLRRRANQEGWQTPDNLLEKMAEQVEGRGFCEQIRTRYRTAIIDEFQDTDPLQWHIFERLFVPDPRDLAGHRVHLYLVGDPKQSIYAFRQADIYTYLRASDQLGANARATLDVNYRSQPKLIEALNALFGHPSAKGWLNLPKTNQELEYRPVASPASLESWEGGDGRGALHFFVAEGNLGRSKRWPTSDLEESQLFPFVVSEIAALRAQGRAQYHECAVLVRDRYQGSALEAALKRAGIPAVVRRSRSLLEGPVAGALVDLVRAVMQPRASSDLRTALGGPLLGWTEDRVAALSDPEEAEGVLEEFNRWRKLFFEQGFWAFYRSLLLQIRPRLLGTDGGEGLLSVLEQLAELVIEEQARTRCTPAGVLAFLEQLKELEQDEPDRLALRQDPAQDAVQILTIHVSKGLEFEIVFALGLCQRNREADTLVPRGRELVACSGDDAVLSEYLAEADAEKMRQFYVALTRAKWRVYVPLAIQVDQKSPPSIGQASPMELFTTRVGLSAEQLVTELPHTTLSNCSDARSAFGVTEACFRFGDTVATELHGNGEPPDPASLAVLMSPKRKQASVTPKALRASDCHGLVEPDRLDLSIVPRRIHSFTSLASPKAATAVTIPEGILPVGSETGVYLHSLLEKAAEEGFSKWLARSDLESWVKVQLRGTVLESWSSTCLQLVKQALTMPLSPLPCTLLQIEQYRAEVEFLYRRNDGDMVKGFIDLVFEWDGLLYLVDWKSNWLPGYSPDLLADCLQQNDYFTQAKLYAEALGRLQPIGGAFYLFLRGLPNEGLYYLPPEQLK